MSGEGYHTFKASEEVDRLFDESSLSHGQQPRFVLILGPVAGGKTTIRKEEYATGYVLVDSADIFLHMSRDESYPFPETFREAMEVFGRMVALRAIKERRHIVTEIIGTDSEAFQALIKAMTAIGYKVELVLVRCPLEQAAQRNLNRGDDAISAYYAEPFQRTWLLEATQVLVEMDLKGLR
jgi:chloramphenicol 3-O-phosphotransferase